MHLMTASSFHLTIYSARIRASALRNSFRLGIPTSTFGSTLGVVTDRTAVVVKTASARIIFRTNGAACISHHVRNICPGCGRLVPSSYIADIGVSITTFGTTLGHITIVTDTGPTIGFRVSIRGKRVNLSSVSGSRSLTRRAVSIRTRNRSNAVTFGCRCVFNYLGTLSGRGRVALRLGDCSRTNVFGSCSGVGCLCLIVPIHV